MTNIIGAGLLQKAPMNPATLAAPLGTSARASHHLVDKRNVLALRKNQRKFLVGGLKDVIDRIDRPIDYLDIPQWGNVPFPPFIDGVRSLQPSSTTRRRSGRNFEYSHSPNARATPPNAVKKAAIMTPSSGDTKSAAMP
jgi:hypothetical protein